MDYKVVILKIIKENQQLGIHKMDRLFHDVVNFSVSWVPIMQELREEKLIEENGYKITSKGLQYLEKKSK
ncbi:hypothetical protein [Empedobacter brevis]|uniref:hypothetical protein n=1 Tax=Empedobacter brevis TaxID=247 RepID=UPI0028AEF550|nr:hypothetical protein [Empedobacter brevis]